MNYSILVFESAEGFAQRQNPAEQSTYWSGTMHYLQALKDAGVFVGGAGLEPPTSAKSFRVESGKHVVQDGPYSDVKEQLGGLFIIRAKDLEEALGWAKCFPERPGQWIEVRPNLNAD